MKQLYTTLLAFIFSVAVFSLLALVDLEKQAELNKMQAKQGWCNVQMGASTATVECNRVSRLD